MKQWCKCMLLLCALVIVTACRHDDGTEDSLKNRIESLEDLLAQMNNDISTIGRAVYALQNQLTVTNIETDDAEGYIITLSDDSQLTIRIDKDDDSGMAGENVPVISVGVFDGMYYWTQNIGGVASWLTDTRGDKVPVADDKAVSPMLKINMEGYWTISYDNGVSH